MKKTTVIIMAMLSLSSCSEPDTVDQQRVQEGLELERRLNDAFIIELEINRGYWSAMREAQTLEDRYTVFRKFRLQYLTHTLDFEIEDMRSPLPGAPADVFPSIVSYDTEEEGFSWSPFSEEACREYENNVAEMFRKKSGN